MCVCVCVCVCVFVCVCVCVFIGLLGHESAKEVNWGFSWPSSLDQYHCRFCICHEKLLIKDNAFFHVETIQNLEHVTQYLHFPYYH